jgi:hypothetical protein
MAVQPDLPPVVFNTDCSAVVADSRRIRCRAETRAELNRRVDNAVETY